MLPRIRLSVQLKDAGIERVREYAIDGTQGNRLSADSLSFWSSESPVFRCHLPKSPGSVVAGCHVLPQSLHQKEAFRVDHDGFGFFVVQVTDGGAARKPPLLNLRPVSPSDVLANEST